MNNPTTPTAQTAPEGAQITPLPWEIYPYTKPGAFERTGIFYITDGHGKIIMDKMSEADAAFAFTACNSHAALTASNAELRRALEESAHQLDLIARNLRSNEMNGTAAMLESMAIRYRAALGKEAK